MMQQIEQQQQQNMSGGGGGLPFEYVQSSVTGEGYLQGPPLTTKEGVIYSSYVDVPSSVVNHVEMLSASKQMQQQVRVFNDENMNVIRNEESGDDYDFEGALNTTQKESRQQTQQRRGLNQSRDSLGFGSNLNSTVMTHHKGERSNQKDRGNSNRKQAPLMSKHFREMEYIHQQAATIHTEDEIYINKPSSGYQDYMKQKELLQRNLLEDDKSEDDPDEIRFVEERRREAKALYKGVRAVKGKLPEYRKVTPNEIMKAFRSKEDFMRILTIEGKLC